MKIGNKRLAGTLLALILAVTAFGLSVFPVSAAEGLSRLVDMADLLSDSEEEELSDILDEISERQQVDVVLVTVGSMEGKTAMEYSDDYFDYNGYGFGEERDGVLLLVSIEDRDWNLSTRGYGITAITDAGREYISEIFLPDLSEGNYAAAFTSYANLCDDFITQAKTGEPYDVDNLPQDPAAYFGGSLLLSFVIAFVIALIVTGIMRMQLKSVYSRQKADDYVKKGSMRLTKKSDLFLYKTVDRRKKPENQSSDNTDNTGNTGNTDNTKSTGGSKTHTSSSGAKHGGGGGKF